MHTLGLKPEEKEKSLPQLALSVGAGLSQGKGINLLPPEIKEQKKRTLQRATWESVFAAATLVLAFIYIGMQITLGNFQKKIAANKMELASFTPQINAARPDIFIQQIAAKEPLWEEVFKELSNVIPTGIYLDEFSQADKQFKLRGKIAAADAQSTLSEFLFALSQSMFKQVKIANAQADTFELECQLN
jgi:Tfp pilus assembly protein PilN